MSRFRAGLSAFILLAAVLFPSLAHAVTTTVSVGFENGFIGEYSNNAHQPVTLKTFSTLGIDSATISDETDNGQFGGSQGNDYSVTVRIQYSDGTTKQFAAAVNWRDMQGANSIHGIGLTVADGTDDGSGYTPRGGYHKTLLLQFVGSTRVYTDTPIGGSSPAVSGNAATSGLLEALNSYLSSAPASTTPSSLTSIISAAQTSIAANGTSTTTITVQLKDVNGNNLTSGGDTVTLATNAGTISNVIDNGNGTYTATLTSSSSITTATITGTVNGLAINDNAQVDFVSSASVAGTLTRANGSAVSGRTVKLVNASNQIVDTTTTAANGTYTFSAVAPGTYSVQFESSGSYKAKAKSATGSNQGNIVSSVTVGASSTITGVDAVVIDPAGVIYSSTTRAPLANAVASLWYNNVKVSNSWLDTGLGGANDQTTGADGFYSFVLNSSASTGTYEIRVIAPSGYTGTPSSAIPASGTYTPSLGGGLEAIQTQSSAPTGAQPTTYYLLFSFTIGANAASTSNGVINNHIPLDPVIAAPVFTNTNATDGSSNPSYSFTYDENRAVGATLGTVSATGTGTLSYSITAGNGSSWFAINPTTGVITLTQAGSASLANDFETPVNVQTLTVQVTDGTRTTTIEVKLNERNVDDTPPVITGPGGVAGALTDAISVNENQTGVTTLTADEPVTWSLVGGEDQAKFTIDPSTGVLTFIASPDFEVPTDGTTSGSNTYIVQVKALDATGNNSSVQTITVTVLDVNEAIAPVFTNTNATDGSSNPSYSFTYDENRATGATLGTVSATGTGSLSYSITAGNGGSWFAIDPTTGVITLTQAGSASLANDFETPVNLQTLTVQVSDGTRTTTIEVKLNERNVDDTPPVITGPGGVAGALTDAISVNENQTAVTTLTADEPVTWSLVGGEDQAKFTIDPSTGVLTFIASPDFEAPTDGTTSGSNTYIVQVKALDATGNNSSVQTITVTVLDVNEAIAPVFTNTNATDGSSNPSYSFTYDENRATGATLGTVSATGTGSLSYSITAGNGGSWFAIDPTTGVITLTQAGSTSLANDYETLANVQTLTVQVSDGTRTTTIEVKLNERNVDDIAYTSISGALTRANRSSGGGAGIGIGGRTVTLVDANNNVVATATTAANGSYSFERVAPGTYAVQFGNALASSQTGTASGSTVSNISVVGGMTVTQVNAVIIDPSGVVYDAVRRTPISNAVVSLYFGGAKVSNSWLDLTLGGANDQTTGADGRYSFILAGTAASGTYEIRVAGPSGYLNTESTLIPSSGIVTPALGGGLDNVQSQATAPTAAQVTTYYLGFAFTIGADAASTSNGIANNHIPLDPVAAPLAFTGTNATDAGNRPSYNFNYNEGRSVGAALGTVSASGGYSANRTFSITGGNSNGWFTVDPATGVISLTAAGAASAANDYETDVNVHILTVQVSDGFGTASIEVKLNEANLDDSVPLITGPSGGAGAVESAITIDEGLTLATTMSANETVTWSLIGGADQAQFVIDPATGALSFVAAPNYETPTDADRNNSYVVQVRAIDANGNVAVQTVTVTIRNVDEIARKLAQIADPLRNGLRSYAARSLGDMLSFNEQLLGDDDVGQCNVQKDKPVSGGFNANNQAQSARLNYAQKLEDCERKYRVYLNGALAASRLHGDWMTRTLASARVETDLSPTLVVGAGLLTTFADDKIRGFATSDISDTSVQLNLYGRKRLTDKLRVAGFVGYGKAWYDFGLTDNGFVMTGKMTGDRYTYGATLTGDIDVAGTPVTTDLIVSRAQERLGTAKLAATYGGEQRSDIGFYIGNVDVTRISVPVHLPIEFQKSAYAGGNSARFEFSPGLLCEDNSVDQSSLSCGFKADAKLLVTRGTRSHAYLDASFETVSGMQRYMGGLGFGYRFGPKDALEIGTNLDLGTTGLRPEARAMIQLKLAQ